MKKESKSVAEIVTEKVLDRIAEAEAKGEVFHWVRPYDFYGGLDKPYSYDKSVPYNGINRLLLDNDEYITYIKMNEMRKSKDAPKLKIREGSKASMVCFYKEQPIIDKETGEQAVDDETQKPLFKKVLRYTPVFSRQDIIDEQGENLPSKFPFKHYSHEEISAQMERSLDLLNRMINHFCEKYGITVKVINDGTMCYFSPSEKQMVVSAMTNWKSCWDWAHTALHELSHVADFELGRPGIENESKEDKYSRGELIAELSASFLVNELKIPDDSSTPENYISYINGWASHLKDKPTEILKAAARASETSNLILESLREIEKEAPAIDTRTDKECDER